MRLAVEVTVGRYVLVERLGGGGFGEAWLARAPGAERVQKLVVVKRLRPERSGEESARARFIAEAKVATSLQHPHIVPVFEFGDAGGEFFLVMEWVRGGPLGRVAGPSKPPLSAAAVALVGSQVCDALAYVHARRDRRGAQLVHGDVTPGNLLLSRDGHVLLADFGLARFAARGGAGTRRYLAPEQARGEMLDGRADLYALALVLVEVLTGRPGYDLDEAQAAAQAKVGLVPQLEGCEPSLAEVLRHALAPLPERRFVDAAAMREAFESVLDHVPGSRALGRAELVRRVAAAGTAEPSLTRSEAATREATQLPAPRRSRLWLAAPATLLLAVVVGWVAHGQRPSAAPGPPLHEPPAKPELPLPLASLPSVSNPAGPVAEKPPEPPAGPIAAKPPETAAVSPSATPPTVAPSVSSPPPSVLSPPSVAPSAASGPLGERGGARPKARPPRPVEAAKLEAPAAPVAEADALLDLNAVPWARVSIDGQDHGETPLLGLHLRPGRHRVELTNAPLGMRRELDLQLRAGEHLQRVERFVQ